MIGDNTKNQLNENICLSVQQTQANPHHAEPTDITKGTQMSQAKNTLSFNKTAAQKQTAQRVTDDFKNRITELANQREIWETTEYNRSNQALYKLIGDCLALYNELTSSDDAKSKKQGLKEYISLKGYVFKETSPLSLKVIRCVFGDRDRRRLSTYHTVLRVAIADKWSVDDVATSIGNYGGVQEISVRKPEGLSAKDKANAARSALMGHSVATLTSEALSKQFNTEHIGENAVAVLTLNGDGTYSVHCVVRSTTAVNAALSGYFSANKEVHKGLQEQQKVQDAETEKTQAINNAITAANESQVRKAA